MSKIKEFYVAVSTPVHPLKYISLCVYVSLKYIYVHYDGKVDVFR